MSNYQFKAGDKVYFPKVSTSIYTLRQGLSKSYPLGIMHEDKSFDDFTVDGKLRINDQIPSLFLVTRENKLLLDELYHMEFDEPITKDGIIQDNINTKGFCLCITSDFNIIKITNIKDMEQNISVIKKIHTNQSLKYEAANFVSWKNAEPIEINSDGTITYLVDD